MTLQTLTIRKYKNIILAQARLSPFLMGNYELAGRLRTCQEVGWLARKAAAFCAAAHSLSTCEHSQAWA